MTAGHDGRDEHRAHPNFVPAEGDCEHHGAYTTTLWPGMKVACPGCRRQREEQARAEVAQQEAEEKHKLALDSMNLHGRFRTATFEAFAATTQRQRDVLHACKQFAAQFSRTQGGSLWLIGPPGTGKSHLGSAIAQAVRFQRDCGAVVMTAREIVRELRSTWRSEATETEADVIAYLGGIDLLVLDEVGIGFGSEAEITQIFDVLDRRYQLERPTVLLSNLNPSMLKSTLGDRLYDRLRDGMQKLVCDWPSHRTPKTSTEGDA